MSVWTLFRSYFALAHATFCHILLPPELDSQASAADNEEEPDTSTASEEDSSNAPWTVVTSPSHKRTDSAEATSRPPPVPEAEEEEEEEPPQISGSKPSTQDTGVEVNPPANKVRAKAARLFQIRSPC